MSENFLKERDREAMGSGIGSRELSREMLHEQIYAMLRDDLMMGRFSPGQHLPLRPLAEQLGTSLMPVRDALQRLESQGCVVSTPRRVMMIPVLTREQHLEICHLRALLESEAVRLAAINRSREHLDKIAQYCDQIEEAGETANLELFLTSNYKFHMTIAEAGGLNMLKGILEPLWMRIGPTVRASKPNRTLIRKAVGCHRDVQKALEEQNAKAAEAAIRRDIEDCHVDGLE